MIICPNVENVIGRLRARGVCVIIKDVGGKHGRAVVTYEGVTVEVLVATTPSDIRGVKNWTAALRRAFNKHGVELPSLHDKKKIVDVLSGDPEAVMLSGFIIADSALYKVYNDVLEEVEQYQLDVGLFNEFLQQRNPSTPLGVAFYDHFCLAEMRDKNAVGMFLKARSDEQASRLISLLFNIE